MTLDASHVLALGVDAVSPWGGGGGGARTISYHRAVCADLTTAVGVAPSWTPSRLGALRAGRQVIPILRAATRRLLLDRSLARSLARLSVRPPARRALAFPSPRGCRGRPTLAPRARPNVTGPLPTTTERSASSHASLYCTWSWPSRSSARTPYRRTLLRRRPRSAPGDVRRISRPQPSQLRPDHRIDTTVANVSARPSTGARRFFPFVVARARSF